MSCKRQKILRKGHKVTDPIMFAFLTAIDDSSGSNTALTRKELEYQTGSQEPTSHTGAMGT